jgi:hypothetical protein
VKEITPFERHSCIYLVLGSINMKQNINEREHATDSLPFASYLLSTKKLPFLRCQPAQAGRVAFVFADSESSGDALYLEFIGGAEAPASSYFDAIRQLRKIMDQIQGAKYVRTANRG